MTLANKKSSNEINAHLENEIKKSIQGEVKFDDVYRQMYSTDGSIYSMTPIGVTLPKTPDDVSAIIDICLLYTSPSPRDRTRSRMPSSA